MRSQLISPTLMFLIQKLIAYYYPQCSGMISDLDDDYDVERGNSSVTPLRYARRRNSSIPSVTDLTGLRSTAISKIKARPSTAASKQKRSQSTVSFTAKRKPTRSTAAGARVKPRRSTAAGARVKPSRSTAVAGRVKPPRRSTAAFKDEHSETTATVMIHQGTDLLTSTVILMPEANNSVDAIQAVV